MINNDSHFGINTENPSAILEVNGSFKAQTVGIGIAPPSNPAYRLFVDGGIKARELRVTVDSFGNYVFQKDYDLLSIKDLDQYISQNNRLPGIPSPEEVVLSGGENLGEMQVILPEKDEYTNSIVTDGNGFSYSAGSFMSHFFYTKSGSLTCFGINDLFLIKNDPMGNEIWSMRLGGLNLTSYESMGSMVMDTLNSRLLITGSFYNTLTLPDTVLSGSELTIFLLAIDLEGHILWARAAGGNGEDRGYGIAYDTQGNVYISGINSKEAFFGQTNIPRGGFLAKYDQHGNFLWTKNKFRYFSISPIPLWPYTESIPYNLLYSDESVIVFGNRSNDTIIIDTISIIALPDSLSTYLSSFSSEGNVKWLRLLSGPEGSCGTKISSDYNGNIFISGTMWDPIGIFGSDTLHSTNGDCFLAKFSPGGTCQWAHGINPSGNALGFSVSTDKENNVYFTGTFQGLAHFGSFTLYSDAPSWMDADIFLALIAGMGTV